MHPRSYRHYNWSAAVHGARDMDPIMYTYLDVTMDAFCTLKKRISFAARRPGFHALLTARAGTLGTET